MKCLQYSVEDGAVDFGALELYSSTTEYIAVENKNPIEIRLKSWGSNSSWSHVELVGMQAGSMEDLTAIRDFDSLKKSVSTCLISHKIFTLIFMQIFAAFLATGLHGGIFD